MYLTDTEQSYFAQNSLKLKQQYSLDGTPVAWSVVWWCDEELQEQIIAINGDSNPRVVIDDAIRFYKNRNAIEYYVHLSNMVIYVTDNLDNLKIFMEGDEFNQLESIEWNTSVNVLAPDVNLYLTLAIFTKFDAEGKVITGPILNFEDNLLSPI